MIDTFSQDSDCLCDCHKPGTSHEYRLVHGIDIEGISIREIAFDKKGAPVCWSLPIVQPCGTVEETLEMLEFAIKDMIRMRKEAFNKPVLDETELEIELEKGEINER